MTRTTDVEHDDSQLILAFQQGDFQAFETLEGRYGRAVYNFIYRLVGNASDAEDLTQDTWLRIVRAAATYVPRAKALTWILQIARNLCLDHFKRMSLRQHQSLQMPVGSGDGTGAMLGDRLPDDAPPPADPLLAQEDVGLLHAALMRLSEKKREAIVMRLWHELPYDEIAGITDTPSGTVKYRVHEAIKDLRAILEESANFRF